ncbi:hypothetical protein JKP88DRAFT_317102 [Tribonema minus]|uniref:Centrosomal protein POC5 n=1 Tax=Tribonema minus TaxID=303371 RepID=A0A835YXP7_9STRA|nr:hypothetical protein JKP88DRAFT_317102 [Tribonema minus]
MATLEVDPSQYLSHYEGGGVQFEPDTASSSSSSDDAEHQDQERSDELQHDLDVIHEEVATHPADVPRTEVFDDAIMPEDSMQLPGELEGISIAESIVRVTSGQDEVGTAPMMGTAPDVDTLTAALREQFRQGLLRAAVDGLVNVKVRMLSEAQAAVTRLEAVRAAEAAEAAALSERLQREIDDVGGALVAAKASTNSWMQREIGGVGGALASVVVSWSGPFVSGWLRRGYGSAQQRAAAPSGGKGATLSAKLAQEHLLRVNYNSGGTAQPPSARWRANAAAFRRERANVRAALLTTRCLLQRRAMQRYVTTISVCYVSAARHAEVHRYDKRVFRWRAAVRLQHAASLRTEAAAQLKAVTGDIVTRYEERLADMATELAAAHATAAAERARGQKLEEDLRRALLRGMTLMNMEALGIFGEKHSAMPAPISTPPTPSQQQCSTAAARSSAAATSTRGASPMRHGCLKYSASPGGSPQPHG